MEIGVRELRNQTTQVIAAVQTGERVTLTVRGEQIADIVPHVRRSRWLSGAAVKQMLATGQADAALAKELDEVTGQTLDTL